MAKFCKFCGAPLEEGQVCTCQSSQTSSVAAPAAPATPSLFAKVKDIFLSYLRTPDAAVRENVNDIKSAGIFAAANAIVVFLYLWKLIAGIFGPLFEGLNDLASALGGKVEITYPIFLFLLGGILLAVLFIGLSALALFAVSKLTKKELSIQQAVGVASYNSTFPPLLLLVGCLLGFNSTGAQLIVLPIAGILWAIFGVRDAREYAGLNPTIATKNLIFQVVAMLVVSMVCVWLTTEITLWCAGGISVEGETLAEGIEAIREAFEDLDIEEFFKMFG